VVVTEWGSVRGVKNAVRRKRIGVSRMYYVYFVGTRNGEWVEAENMHSAKWIFALKNGSKSLSYIRGSKKEKK